MSTKASGRITHRQHANQVPKLVGNNTALSDHFPPTMPYNVQNT